MLIETIRSSLLVADYISSPSQSPTHCPEP
jgi:hypothetical protein